MREPAILGGKAAFDREIPMLKPYLPALQDLYKDLEHVFSSGQITNGTYVRQFEEETSRFLGVKHSVAVSSCTVGMMLVAKILNLNGNVIVPSFTFSATGHALAWCGLRLVFTECRSDTFNIDGAKIEEQIDEETTGMVVPHIFGNPADVGVLTEIASRHKLSLFFDAAHAFSSRWQGRTVGANGNAEIFSLSPTKVLIAGEGGLVTTNDDALALAIRTGRNYGDPGDYDCPFYGLNARMTETSAILGLASLKLLPENVARRTHIAGRYLHELGDLPGISFQTIEEGNQSTWKDFSIVINPQAFVLNRDQLSKCLFAERIQTRKYFHPPLHKMKAYKGALSSDSVLPVTEKVSDNILSLPIYYRLKDDEVSRIIESIRIIHHYRNEIVSKMKKD